MTSGDHRCLEPMERSQTCLFCLAVKNQQNGIKEKKSFQKALDKLDPYMM